MNADFLDLSAFHAVTNQLETAHHPNDLLATAIFCISLRTPPVTDMLSMT
jgi:hypothetical protein